MPNFVNYKYGTQTAYDSLGSKDANALYFLTDSRRIYKGNSLLASDNVIATDTMPAVSDAFPNVIYIHYETNTVSIKALNKDKTGFVVLSTYSSESTDTSATTFMNKTISADSNTITDLTITNFKDTAIAQTIGALDDTSYDAAVARTKFVTENAVRTFVSDNVSTLNTTIDGLFKDVSYDATTGTFTFTKEDGTTKELVTPVENFLSNASYDNNTHTLTLTLESGTTIDVDMASLVPAAISTNDVSLSEDIAIIGVSAVGANKKGLTKDMTITEILKSIFQKTINPTKIMPTSSLSANNGLSNGKKVEVGTDFASIQLTGNFTSGSYQYKDGGTVYGTTSANNEITSYKVTKKAPGAEETTLVDGAAIEVATDENVHITDGQLVYKATFGYSDGIEPKNNVGGTQSPDDGAVITKIAAGSINSSITINGIRRMFYGVYDATVEAPTVNSAFIRALGNSTTEDPNVNTEYKLSYAVGDATKFKRLYVALPAGYRLSQFQLRGALNTSILENCTSSAVQVSGKTADADMQAYTVYVYEGLAYGGNPADYYFKVAKV